MDRSAEKRMKQSPSSRGLLLAEGQYPVTHCGQTSSCHCRITFDLGRNSTLLIECLDPMPFEFENTLDEPFLVSVPLSPKPTECFPIRTELIRGGERGGMYVSLVPRFSTITLDHGQPLIRVNAGIANLGHYLIDSPSTLHFRLESDKWKFHFTTVDERVLLYPPSVQDETYFLTHHLAFEKIDCGHFSGSEADEQLDNVSLFLSFCHEHWVSPVLVTGVDVSGTVSWEQWGTRLLSKWSRGQNWLDEHHGQSMIDVFPGFAHRVQEAAWKQAVKKIVYWYVRADSGYVGPDGAIILLQAALETLSWHILVRHKSALSEAGFSRLTAADQIRLLLSVASIPADIPPGLTHLQAAANNCGWQDGPEAFVGIRNRLVHPPRKATSNMGRPYYDGYVLGKWYLELVLLRAFGYKGVYSNRTSRNRWIGQVEPVPWARGGPVAGL